MKRIIFAIIFTSLYATAAMLISQPDSFATWACVTFGVLCAAWLGKEIFDYTAQLP